MRPEQGRPPGGSSRRLIHQLLVIEPWSRAPHPVRVAPTETFRSARTANRRETGSTLIVGKRREASLGIGRRYRALGLVTSGRRWLRRSSGKLWRVCDLPVGAVNGGARMVRFPVGASPRGDSIWCHRQPPAAVVDRVMIAFAQRNQIVEI